MRLFYIDIDTLRPDHLGCYGYPRATSPNIDRVAAEGVRFDRCYASDTPCGPSRTALFSGRFGIRTGVVNHGGTGADPFRDGATRGFRDSFGLTSWPARLRWAGFRTASISSFGDRHAAHHWYAGWNETVNVGQFGLEQAHDVMPLAHDWLERHGRGDRWFLHVHLWDPHTPYRVPEEFGEPFADAPHPDWITDEVRAAHWHGCGPHSAREVMGFTELDFGFPRQPAAIDSAAAVRHMFDGYDTGIRYADEHIGRLLNALADLNVLDDTAIIVSSDHGENLGELNIYGDHQTADEHTARIPLIVRWPDAGPVNGGRVDRGLYYHVDLAATVLKLVGTEVPENWNGHAFAEAFREGREAGRDHLVLSQGAWTCQRAVRFEDYLCIRTYHDGYHAYPEVMLFDVAADPHEQHDLASERSDLVDRAQALLEDWHATQMRDHPTGADPLEANVAEGGGFHIRGELPGYLERLRATGRGEWADRLAAAHPREATA